MTAIKANGITIEYEEMGPPDAPVILLIMGLGMQLIAWPEPFCGGLAARGFRVVRFDNRDAGLSTRMPSAGSLATSAMMARAFLGHATSDALGTGWYAADAARVQPGSTVVVVGDGAVELMGVLDPSSRRKSRHRSRTSRQPSWAWLLMYASDASR